jgi:uncharacterized protein (TIGR02688 family)
MDSTTLIQTVGYNPYRLEERVKHLLLLRLVPFVESNYNVIELGPRETGKTYMYKNTSPQAFVVSSGKSTPATLFYHKAWKRVGVIGLKDVVVFDEVAREGEGEPKFDAETIDTFISLSDSNPRETFKMPSHLIHSRLLKHRKGLQHLAF